MPPKKNDNTSGADGDAATTQFSEGDAVFLQQMFNNMKEKPDIDWENLAANMGMTAKSAKERFRKMSKKHGWMGVDGSAGPSPAKGKGKGAALAPKASKVAKNVTPKKGTARKKVKKEESESDDDEDISAKLESDSDGKTVPKNEPMGGSESDQME